MITLFELELYFAKRQNINIICLHFSFGFVLKQSRAMEAKLRDSSPSLSLSFI